VSDDLAAGRLLRPLRHVAPTTFSYYLVHRPAALANTPLAAFVAWLRSEAEAWRAAACCSGSGD
jgi:DNA-binding transcriptional LysR family regulator